MGCGVSVLAESIVECGLAEQVTAIDFSETCVALMRKREQARGGRGSIAYEVMDATNMEFFNDDSFDFIFDKGTFDAIVTGDDDDASPVSGSNSE